MTTATTIRARGATLVLALIALTCSGPAAAASATVAVAANFLVPLREIAAAFEAESGHELLIAPGSTGQLYAQIVNGAPYDVFLAADRSRPRRLAESGVGRPGTLFTYAVGQLALWSRSPDLVDDGTLERLPEVSFHWLAIAEPRLAPYGAAARQTLDALGEWPAIQARIVTGQSVAQTFAMAETGNADLAFVALSQALAYDGDASWALVPAALHEPIRQDAILLTRAEDNAAALAFLDFLHTQAAGAILERYGYATDKP